MKGELWILSPVGRLSNVVNRTRHSVPRRADLQSANSCTSFAFAGSLGLGLTALALASALALSFLFLAGGSTDSRTSLVIVRPLVRTPRTWLLLLCWCWRSSLFADLLPSIGNFTVVSSGCCCCCRDSSCSISNRFVGTSIDLDLAARLWRHMDCLDRDQHLWCQCTSPSTSDHARKA